MKLAFITRVRELLYSNISLVILTLVFIAIALVTFLSNNQLFLRFIEKSPNDTERESAVPLVAQGPIMEKSEPIRLRIPVVNIDTTFEETLGLNNDNTIEVPNSYEEVGWYQYGPTPGELGPSVILGHVDSYDGPAVFFPLGQLKAGDEIIVDRADGTVAKFEVTKLERHRQSGFPTELVYGDIDHAGLRLITCTGVFARGEQQYTHNLIVFARLMETS